MSIAETVYIRKFDCRRVVNHDSAEKCVVRKVQEIRVRSDLRSQSGDSLVPEATERWGRSSANYSSVTTRFAADQDPRLITQLPTAHAAAVGRFSVRLGSQLASHGHLGNRPVSTARRAQPAAPMKPALPPREAYSIEILSAIVANVRERNSCWTRFRNSRPT